MPDGTPTPPLDPRLATFPAPPRGRSSRGCLKWGLVGCAGISVLLIVGLMAGVAKLKPYVEGKLNAASEQILAKTTPDVTADDKAAFQKAYKAFMERFNAGKIPLSRISGVSNKVDAAQRSESVSPEQLRDLTSELDEAK